MAQLKEHMLYDIANTVFSRQRAPNRFFLPASHEVTQFFLSGKGPSRVFSQMVGTDVIIIACYDSTFEMQYRGQIYHTPIFMKKFFLRFARRLSVYTHTWYACPWQNSKILRENRDMEEVIFHHPPPNNKWIDILEIFPNLVSVTLKSSEFAKMLSQASNQLLQLREVVFSDSQCVDDYKSMAEYREKIPLLETVRYDAGICPFSIEYPESGSTIPTVKELVIVSNSTNRQLRVNPLDFPWTTMQTFFPSLKSVRVTINADLYCKIRDICDYELLYQAFHSLSHDFSIRIHYREKLPSYIKNRDEVYEFLSAQGDVYETTDGFKVITSLPRKLLIHEGTIKPSATSGFSSDDEDY